MILERLGEKGRTNLRRFTSLALSSSSSTSCPRRPRLRTSFFRSGAGSAEPSPDAAREALREVGLEGKAAPLSPGSLRRRAAAGRSSRGPWSRDRPAILADEPTGNLDTHTGDQVLDLLTSRCREAGDDLDHGNTRSPYLPLRRPHPQGRWTALLLKMPP